MLYHHKPQKSKTFAEKQPTRYWRFTITLIGQEQFSTGAFDLEIPGNWDLIHTHYGDFLVPKIDCSIDDALNDIRTATEGTIFAEFANAALIAKMAVTDCFLEPEKKNVYNSKSFLEPYMHSQGEIAPASAFQELCFEKVTDKRTVETGDYVYLKGHPLYTSLNSTGISRGENVYMVGYGVDNLRMYSQLHIN